MADAAKHTSKLRPSVALTCKVARGLREHRHDRECQSDRDHSSRDEEETPAIRWDDLPGDNTRDNPADGYANDGERDGNRPLTLRHVLRGQRGGIWHRPAEAETGQQPERHQHGHAV